MSESSSTDAPDTDGPEVRTYQSADQSAVSYLYTEGMLEGQIPPNDTGADIENIREAYFDEDRHHFWVAQEGDQVVGMIGVGTDEPHTAEIRRLRVRPEYQAESAIAARLLRTAVNHCKHHGCLKVRLDTRFEHDAAVGLLDALGFQHTRTKTSQGKEMLEFYLDLYRQPQKEKEKGQETHAEDH